MLQKLRLKFIALSMGILLLVLTIIMGGVNLLNYQHIISSTDHVLEILLSNDGAFPKTPPRPERAVRKNARTMSPELPFETRFFTVRMDTSGNVISVDIGRIAAVDNETAAAYAAQIHASGRERGFVGEYRYRVQSDDNGKLLVFQDCGRQLDTARSFLKISTIISFVGFFAVSLLLYIFSATIVKPIAESYEKQKQFITNASHDLKTPITIINADVDVLEIDQGENEWLQDIKKQTQRLSDLIRELVFLSRMEEGNNHFQMIEFPVSDVVSETAQSFESLAVTQGKTFSLNVQPMLSYCGDERSLSHLIEILMDNALKHSDENGQIILSFQRTERGLRLSVYNTCESMPKEHLKNLFERFYRGDKSRNPQTGGYGIGLSIAKAIVEAHKGTITAETTDGHSLSVVVFLPLK